MMIVVVILLGLLTVGCMVGFLDISYHLRKILEAIAQAKE